MVDFLFYSAFRFSLHRAPLPCRLEHETEPDTARFQVHEAKTEADTERLHRNRTHMTHHGFLRFPVSGQWGVRFSSFPHLVSGTVCRLTSMSFRFGFRCLVSAPCRLSGIWKPKRSARRNGNQSEREGRTKQNHLSKYTRPATDTSLGHCCRKVALTIVPSRATKKTTVTASAVGVTIRIDAVACVE